MLFREVSFIFIIHPENVTEHVITLCQSIEFLSVNCVSTRTALFWDITKHVVLVTDIPGQPVGPILRVPESKRIGFLSS
jgi:hypothetical protein